MSGEYLLEGVGTLLAWFEFATINKQQSEQKQIENTLTVKEKIDNCKTKKKQGLYGSSTKDVMMMSFYKPQNIMD